MRLCECVFASIIDCGCWEGVIGLGVGLRIELALGIEVGLADPRRRPGATAAHLKIVVEVLEDEVQLAVAVHNIFEPHDVRVDQVLQ